MPWPSGWQASARFAALSCACCGRGEQRDVPGGFELGDDTGLLCQNRSCLLCGGWCRATFLVAAVAA